MTPRKPEPNWYARADKARFDLKWSVAELTRRIGLDSKKATKVRRWLSGEAEAPFVEVVKIADALGMSLDTLAGRLPEPDADWDDASLAAVLKAAGPHAQKVIPLLNDPRAVAYLANAADAYRALERSRAR